jgi:4-hydroxybenzoate polyprenyltransferase
MTAVRVAGTMLRLRVASLLVPFFLLAPAMHGTLAAFRWQYVTGVVALFASYIVATCLNDVFDVEIDRVNHPASPDRPLVTGVVTRRQMLALSAALALIALAAAAATGPHAPLVLTASLLLNVAYSAPPLRLTSRPLAAPAVLGIAYVALPYAFGLAAGMTPPDGADFRLVAAFVVLFAGRMLLKDFRDRRGDALFGKRTFLLTYGKRATVFAVLGCIAAGDAMLTTVLLNSPVLLVAAQTYFAAIVFQVFRLARAAGFDDERIAIALGARMANALVLSLLGYLAMAATGASAMQRNVFVLAMAAIFWLTFVVLSRREAPVAAATATSA